MSLRLGAWMIRSFDLWPGGVPSENRSAYGKLVGLVEAAWDRGVEPWRRIPVLVREVFGPRGWEWNGIYARAGDELRLAASAGPPVCAVLERRGGVGTSGMCWDGILMNQTLAAADVARWPGYVSCDRESGLSTAAGIVCPIRDAAGAPIAVWDLDATEPLFPGDPVFLDRLFATLSALDPPSPETFGV